MSTGAPMHGERQCTHAIAQLGRPLGSLERVCNVRVVMSTGAPMHGERQWTHVIAQLGRPLSQHLQRNLCN
jgi:hypothetical protein